MLWLGALRTGVLTKKSAGACIVAALLYSVLLLAPFLLLILVQATGTLTGPTNSDDRDEFLPAQEFTPGLALSPAAYRVLVRSSIFSSVAAFGALGAAVSVLSRTRSNVTKGHTVSVVELISMQTIGAVFALILCLMFMGEMIAGSLFPQWDPFYRIIYSPPAFGKLLVWSFIAGFSERLVPRILANLSRHAGKDREQITTIHTEEDDPEPTDSSRDAI